MAKSKSINSSGFHINKFVLIILLIILIPFGFYFYGNSHYQTSTPEETLNSLQKFLKTKVPASQVGKHVIDTSEAEAIENNKKITFSGTRFDINNVYLENSIPPDEFVEEIGSSINSFFIDNGFTGSKENEISKLTNIKLFSFKKGDFYCFSNTDNNSSLYLSVFCGKYDVAKTEQKAEFYPVLNPDNDPNFTFNIVSHSDNYAYVNEGFGVGGDWVILMKNNSGWIKILQGQDLPLCSSVDNYNVPSEIYGNCYINSKTSELRFKPPSQ